VRFLRADRVGLFSRPGEHRQIGLIVELAERGRASNAAKAILALLDKQRAELLLRFGGAFGSQFYPVNAPPTVLGFHRDSGEKLAVATPQAVYGMLAIVENFVVGVTP